MDTMDNKCPSCSAKIEYNPMTQTWDCSACGSKFTQDQINNSVSTISANDVANVVSANAVGQNTIIQNNNSTQFAPINSNQVGTPTETPIINQENTVNQQVINNQHHSNNQMPSVPTNKEPSIVTPTLPKETELNGLSQYTCKSCGTVFYTDNSSMVPFCVYCGNGVFDKVTIEEESAPTLIIPFKKTKKDAVNAFKGFMAHKPLTPREFRKITDPNKIVGVYVPFWAYDITCDGNISFHCADVERWADNDYKYMKTTKFDTNIFSHLDFSKVLMNASNHFRTDSMEELEPYNFEELVDFNHGYLAGYIAEKYDVTDEEAYIGANEQTMNQCIEESKKETGHQNSVLKENHLYLSKKATNSILLPVYMVPVKYKDKEYFIAMNGQTGKVIGELPVGLVESIICGVVLFILLCGIAYLFSLLGR